ncbi:MAG: Crp/Fnr family transcriptional regulator [Lachnospiraceae bacterium]|nr:Crp/Fnr family transcriptional regulator [Lachnospiraceae bacterium]
MINNLLDKYLPILTKIDEKKREQVYSYFKNAPIWILESFSIEKMKKGKTFIREGYPADTIYFIVDGLVKASDYRVCDIKYDFILFSDFYAFGGMEVLMDIDTYRTSIETVTDSTILKLPRKQFARWLATDISALKYEAKLMGENLLQEARTTRLFLFLQGADRLMMLFVNRYKKFSVDGKMVLKNDRQELGEYTGLSAKTITRAIKKLEEEGMLTKKGNNVVISRDQYLKMEEKLSEMIFQNE